MFVLVLAFLLASFPARHSELWKHLAAGRSLVLRVTSSVSVHSESFEAGTRRSWLFNLFEFGIYSTLTGRGLVIVNALLVVGLGLILLQLGRTRQDLWIPAICAALALLPMSTRLLVQPVTMSFVFLALTLLLHRRAEPVPRSWLPPRPLAMLFVIWANVDSGFVFGLATLALVWLGQEVDFGRSAGRLQVLLRRLSAGDLGGGLPAESGARVRLSAAGWRLV